MTEEDLQDRLVGNLRRLRKARKLTQEGLAEKAGLSAQIINDIEGGRRWPRRATLAKVTAALEADVQELFRAEKNDSPSGLCLQSQLMRDLKDSIDGVLKKYSAENSSP